MLTHLKWYPTTIAGAKCLVTECTYPCFESIECELPEDVHLHHIRHKEDNSSIPESIELNVIDHWGLLLTTKKLIVDDNDHMILAETEMQDIITAVSERQPEDPVEYLDFGHNMKCCLCGMKIRHQDECAALAKGIYNSFETDDEVEGFSDNALSSNMPDQSYGQTLLCNVCYHTLTDKPDPESRNNEVPDDIESLCTKMHSVRDTFIGALSTLRNWQKECDCAEPEHEYIDFNADEEPSKICIKCGGDLR